jgi:hypothetical protein
VLFGIRSSQPSVSWSRFAQRVEEPRWKPRDGDRLSYVYVDCRRSWRRTSSPNARNPSKCNDSALPPPRSRLLLV